MMTVFTASALGQISGTGNIEASFIRAFTQEVLAEFEAVTQITDIIPKRALKPGNIGERFPVLTAKTARYMATRGIEVTGQNQVQKVYRTVSVDRPEYTDEFIDDQDGKFEEFDVRSPYSKLMGRALAYRLESKLMRTAVKAALVADVGTPGTLGYIPGGKTLLHPNMRTDINTFVTYIQAAAAELDRKNVPSDGRVCFVDVDTYYSLMNVSLFNNTQTRGESNPSMAVVGTMYGFTFLKTNFMPSNGIQVIGATPGTTGIYVGEAGERNDYAGNFVKNVGICMHPMALAQVVDYDIKTIVEERPSQLGTLIMAAQANGVGIIDPKLVVALSVA
jgi:hypothetical protein